MRLLSSKYDPEPTDTYVFFGRPNPQARLSPVACFFRDIVNVFLNFSLVHVVLSTFKTDRPIDELYLWAPTALSLVWFTAWSIPQAFIVLTLLACFMIIAAALHLITSIIDLFIWRPIQGPQLQVYPPSPPEGYNKRHRWIYINGIATGKTITRQNLEFLSKTFHNPVLAVNNRTYGFLGDIMECIVQRAFNYTTKETGIACDIIKSYLADHVNVDKVILIAHSQGGIIASQILDELYCDMCPEELGKLEVYTFGSAALAFKNPYKDRTHTTRVVPVMEHYCNERDMVTSWGALASADRESTPFVGTVFVFKGKTGHMLNQHYLKYMFTGPPNTWEEGNFQLRVARKDEKVPDKYYVEGWTAKTKKGEKSVKDLSDLWKHL